MVVRRGPLRLHIERLVLDGVSTADPAGLGRAVEAELTRLLAQHVTPFPSTTGADVQRLDAGDVSWGEGASSEALGARVAGAVYKSLGGNGS